MQSFNNKPKKSKRLYLSRFLLVSIISLSQILGVMSPAPTAADATPTKVGRYEALRGLLATNCANDGAGTQQGIWLFTKITSDQFSNKDFSPISANISGTTFYVSALLFDGETKMSCARALSYYYGGAFNGGDLGQKREAFLRKYYDVDHPGTDDISGDTIYNLKGGTGSGNLKDYTKEAKEMYNTIHDYTLSLISGETTQFEAWRDRIISKDFNDCWKWHPKDSANTHTDISDATAEEKKDPDNWAKQDNNTESNKVGWMAEKEIKGSYSDGAVSCDEVKSYIFPDHTDLIGFGDDDLNDALAGEAKAKASAKILDLLGKTNPNVIVACLASSGLPTTISTATITAWLVSGDSKDLEWRNGNNVHATDEQATSLLGCLSDPKNIPGLADILKDLGKDLASIKESIEKITPSSAKADACLAEDDFVAWFACPALNIIDKVLEGLQKQIQEWLKFDLDQQNVDNGSGDGGIHAAWNVFRALATVLIMGGFLLALLVKGVRGE